jgi:bacteriochlorophyllide a dehydrogenase
MSSAAIVMTAPGAVDLSEVHVPDPGPDEVLVEADYTCVSPGTELRCLAGRQPNPIAFPFVPGYALTGRVIERGSGVELATGTRVLCKGTQRCDVNLQWGGHTHHAVLAAADVIALPDQLDSLAAAPVKLAAIAYHGVRLARSAPHERVLVVGLGPIGYLSALLHSTTGAQVIAVDVAPERVEVARESGLDARLAQGGIGAALSEESPPGFDVVVDATGHEPAIDEIIAMARDLPWDNSLARGARYVIQGSYADRFSVPPLAAFEKELAFLMPRDHQRRDIEAVLSLLTRGKLDLSALTTDVRSPRDAAEVYGRLAGDKGSTLTTVFDWR